MKHCNFTLSFIIYKMPLLPKPERKMPCFNTWWFRPGMVYQLWSPFACPCITAFFNTLDLAGNFHVTSSEASTVAAGALTAECPGCKRWRHSLLFCVPSCILNEFMTMLAYPSSRKTNFPSFLLSSLSPYSFLSLSFLIFFYFPFQELQFSSLFYWYGISRILDIYFRWPLHNLALIMGKLLNPPMGF